MCSSRTINSITVWRSAFVKSVIYGEFLLFLSCLQIPKRVQVRVSLATMCSLAPHGKLDQATALRVGAYQHVGRDSVRAQRVHDAHDDRVAGGELVLPPVVQPGPPAQPSGAPPPPTPWLRPGPQERPPPLL